MPLGVDIARVTAPAGLPGFRRPNEHGGVEYGPVVDELSRRYLSRFGIVSLGTGVTEFGPTVIVYVNGDGTAARANLPAVAWGIPVVIREGGPIVAYRAAGTPPNPDAGTASLIGAGTAGVRLVTGYVQGESANNTADTLSAMRNAGYQSAADAAVNTAEGQSILTIARARLLASQAAAPTTTQGTPLPDTSVPPQSPAAPQQTAASSGGAVAVVALLAVGAAGGGWWYFNRKSPR